MYLSINFNYLSINTLYFCADIFVLVFHLPLYSASISSNINICAYANSERNKTNMDEREVNLRDLLF